MIQFISRYLTSQLIVSQMIQQEDKDVYEYGILLILMTTFTEICILIVGFYCGQLTTTLVFLVGLMQLRHYAGGYHAQSFSKCFCMSCGAYGITLGGVYLNQQISINTLWISLSLLATVYLYRVGSVNSTKNPKTSEEMKIRARRTRFITISYSLIASILLTVYPQGADIAVALISVQLISGLGVYVIQEKEGLL